MGKRTIFCFASHLSPAPTDWPIHLWIMSHIKEISARQQINTAVSLASCRERGAGGQPRVPAHAVVQPVRLSVD